MTTMLVVSKHCFTSFIKTKVRKNEFWFFFIGDVVNFIFIFFTARKGNLGQGDIFTLVYHSIHTGGSASWGGSVSRGSLHGGIG